jgi:hypothetical protein
MLETKAKIKNGMNDEAVEEQLTVCTSADELLSYLRSKEMQKADTAKVVLKEDGAERELNFIRHINPDGTKGGFIDSGLSSKSLYGVNMTPKSSFIDPTAVVYGNVTIENSTIGANTSILALGQAGSYIVDTKIGDSVTLKSEGLLGPIVLDSTTIEDRVSMDISRGILYIVRSTIRSGVVLDSYADPAESGNNFMVYQEFIAPYASGKKSKRDVHESSNANAPKLSIKVLDIDDSDIGKDSVISLKPDAPRLRILHTTVPPSSKISVDPSSHYISVAIDQALTNIFYKVHVPLLTEQKLSTFISDAEDYAKMHKLPNSVDQRLLKQLDPASAKELERVIMLAKFVYDRIQYEDIASKYTNDKTDIPIDYFIDKGKGICFEHALLLYTILEKELTMQGGKVTPHFVTGLAKSDEVNSWHAWIEVEINGKVFVIDATSPFMFAGKRTKSGKFVRSGPMIDWDYRPDGTPLVTTPSNSPSGVKRRG